MKADEILQEVDRQRRAFREIYRGEKGLRVYLGLNETLAIEKEYESFKRRDKGRRDLLGMPVHTVYLINEPHIRVVLDEDYLVDYIIYK